MVPKTFLDISSKYFTTNKDRAMRLFLLCFWVPGLSTLIDALDIMARLNISKKRKIKKMKNIGTIFWPTVFFVIIYLDRISNASIKVGSPESWEYNKKGFIFLFSLFVKFSLEISRTVIGTISWLDTFKCSVPSFAYYIYCKTLST